MDAISYLNNYYKSKDQFNQLQDIKQKCIIEARDVLLKFKEKKEKMKTNFELLFKDNLTEEQIEM